MTDKEKKHVLVVDDEADIRIFLRTVLEDSGFDVATASDGNEALRETKKKKPDLISLDLIMPKKSGIRFLYELRHKKEWARIPVVIVTGHARDEAVRKDMDETFAGKTLSGPQVYLEKPVKPQDFVNMVKLQLGIETEESHEDTPSTEELRSRILGLAEMSDTETLKDVLQMLQGKKK